MKQLLFVWLSIFVVALNGCAVQDTSTPTPLEATKPTAEQQEVDQIFSLLAYAVVYKNWQEESTPNPRGHNIGSVLVDSDNNPVFWARNANAITKNSSQHGEVRVIHNFLQCSQNKYLSGYTIYTTLEPCAMCTGMMSLTKVDRSVYGQKDPGYGDALERLALDSSKQGGYSPYPRLFISTPSPAPQRTALELVFSKFRSDNITEFLRSEEAKAIFSEAFSELSSKNEDSLATEAGKLALKRAQAYLMNVSASYTDPLSLCDSYDRLNL